MNGFAWLVCERTQRWASAVRIALARQPVHRLPQRIYETRNLKDMLSQLAANSTSIVLIEVEAANLSAVLGCLADAAPKYPDAGFAALLDYELTALRASAPAGSEPTDVQSALVEAGAGLVVASPRRLDDLLRLAERHAKFLAMRPKPARDLRIQPWARALLPWQAEERPVG